MQQRVAARVNDGQADGIRVGAEEKWVAINEGGAVEWGVADGA